MDLWVRVYEFFHQFLSAELAVIVTAAVPIVELRGAIPLAALLGMSAGKAFVLSVVGNIIPIIPLLLALDPVAKYLARRFKTFERFFDWLYARTMRKSDNVQKYGALGLLIFTAVPLPTTGAWTACAAAVLFRIPFYLAFPAISVGVVLAGVIVTLISYGVF